MRQLPDYCDPNVLVIPAMSSEVKSWLRRHDSDALESLLALGVPQVVGVSMQARSTLDVTQHFQHWVPTAGGQSIGVACRIGENKVPLREPSREDWVIAADGRIIHCCDYDDDQSAFQQNTSYSRFLVFETALGSVPMCDEAAVIALLPKVGRIDPWAFESEFSPWPEIWCEQIYGTSWPDGERQVREVALGR